MTAFLIKDINHAQTLYFGGNQLETSKRRIF